VPNLPLTLTCSDYARIMPLASGQVRPDGIDLTLITSQPASWDDRQEIMRRALHDPAVHGGEASMSGQLRRLEQGDRRFVALPVFVLRNFVARDLYVSVRTPRNDPTHLAGKRIAMFNWVASASVWYRHFLRTIGVDLTTIEWWVGDVDLPTVSEHAVTLPPQVRTPPPGRMLSDMLLAGEIDAIFNPQKPRLYDPANGPILRFFDDIRAVDRAYLRQTGGIFPPQHLILLRRDAWEPNPWIAPALTNAFAASGESFNQATRLFPYVSPWLDIELQETVALMGENFHPVGLQQNRTALETFCTQAWEAGVTGRRIEVEDYFAEFLRS
jgi:4,5-dihydroxyphthalate decarboxylase